MSGRRNYGEEINLYRRWCKTSKTVSRDGENFRVTLVGVARVGSGCSHLQELYTNDCTNLTDVGVAEVGKGCPNLEHLGLEGCPNITSECKNALRQSRPDLDIEEDYVCDGSV